MGSSDPNFGDLKWELGGRETKTNVRASSVVQRSLEMRNTAVESRSFRRYERQ